MRVCITIDAEDLNDSVIWKETDSEIDIHRSWEVMSGFLKNMDLPATFFVLGTFAEKYPDILKSIRKSSYEVGSHFYSHQNLYLLEHAEVLEGIKKSKKVLGKVRGFRAPIYSMHKGIAEILEKEGFLYDSSVFPSIFYPHPSIKRVEKSLRIVPKKVGAPYRIGGLVEIPLTVFPSYLGLPITGTTIRMYGGLISSLIRFYRGDVLVLNMHPFEFLKSPRVKGSPWWFSINSGEPFIKRLTSIIKRLKNIGAEFKTMETVAGDIG
jgi:peptidoglycan/xylan/chitin deacetylase (PgdA/CDA1 family)